ncbi:hypothetical protein AB4Z01_10495 [Inquilinus sp. YAF38]|uniref:hypothetical protein n=1 Tax=Inquilinus sp. YAF38 TaxID=3233084 RepID=UPI003F9202F1
MTKHNPLMTRRVILMGSAVSIALPSRAAPSDSTVHCYIGQSGKPWDELHLGALITRNPSSHKQSINIIRDVVNYTRVLRTRTTEHLKLIFFPELLRYLLRQNEMKFMCIKFQNLPWPDDAFERDILYLQAHRLLLNNSSIKPTSELVIHLTDHGVTHRDIFKKALSEVEPWKPSSRFHYIDQDDLVQIAHFLTGLVNCEAKESRVRREIVSLAKKELNASSFTEEAFRNHPFFRIRQISV